MSVFFLLRDDSEWEYVYVVAAKPLRQGVDIYVDGNAYPLFAAFTALPASFLSPPLVRVTWLGTTLLSLAVMARGAWRLTGGGALQGITTAPFVDHPTAVL